MLNNELYYVKLLPSRFHPQTQKLDVHFKYIVLCANGAEEVL